MLVCAIGLSAALTLAVDYAVQFHAATFFRRHYEAYWKFGDEDPVAR